tara:strand:+ start:23 stop:502 length:480 start_codon:yes stop_codon:yes gene_type:complete
MIITCEKCSKKFNIQDHLIPPEGRFLQCGSCNHKWFYKSIPKKTNLEKDNTNDPIISKSSADEKEKIIKSIIENDVSAKKKKLKKEEKKITYKNKKELNKSQNLIKISIVVFISIIALIILIDTFKFQLEKYIPGINFVLNNLYETLKDISLFAKDLIK